MTKLKEIARKHAQYYRTDTSRKEVLLALCELREELAKLAEERVWIDYNGNDVADMIRKWGEE